MMRSAVPRLALVLLLAAMVAWLAFSRDKMDPTVLDAWMEGIGMWAPLAYVALFAIATVAFVPGAVFGLAGGALFGPLWGSILNLLGATAGATIAFLVARYVASDWVRRRTGPRVKRLIEGVEAEGWRFVALVRLIPLFPFNLSNYALGLSRIPLRAYVLTSLLCMVPGVVAYAWLGYAGRGALTGEAGAIRYALLALAFLAAVALLPPIVRRMRSHFGWIEPRELKRRLDEGETMTIVDVRTPEEFAGTFGHIPAALNVPLPKLTSWAAQTASIKKAPVVLVCRTDKRSVKAVRVLHAAGFAQVGVLRSGMEQWNEEGFPVQGQAQESRPKVGMV
jgi:uncharacterized membrane protein YdjX (TVP38/TMEM64 family)/rhodanese-related sulfurtransferase